MARLMRNFVLIPIIEMLIHIGLYCTHLSMVVLIVDRLTDNKYPIYKLVSIDVLLHLNTNMAGIKIQVLQSLGLIFFVSDILAQFLSSKGKWALFAYICVNVYLDIGNNASRANCSWSAYVIKTNKKCMAHILVYSQIAIPLLLLVHNTSIMTNKFR